MKTKGKGFTDLVRIMDRLRGPDGCPWDNRQTKQSLLRFLMDEAYEVAEAIDLGSAAALKEELGDLLFQILFLSKLAEEAGEFTIDDVIASISEKMIRRHPHVFGGGRAEDAEEVKQNWAKIKEMEGKPGNDSDPFSGIPSFLPALHRAEMLSRKAAAAGFEWPSLEDIMRKVEEEWQELKEALHKKQYREMREEYGDLLFVLVNLARFLELDPEAALRSTNQKFIRRFQLVAEALEGRTEASQSLSADQWKDLWNMAKDGEREKLRNKKQKEKGL